MSIGGPALFTPSQTGCVARPSEEAAVLGLCRQDGASFGVSEARRAVVSTQSTWEASGFGVDGSVATCES